ncbi:hypothetical protein THAOC_30385 [Thalassiosira oceanica]|uniref:Uncharacterized protein n=1 Tax=Thalassiosira oceanica TaxID=159749 RepID=K0RAB0_THAOC|nr:hypothetical protein THAOC_30385 [Thalassiosira oceanica]|eukprot:EJK50583.1 hypothetical protein THAOC_30385 [Thalassiosira oceanica]
MTSAGAGKDAAAPSIAGLWQKTSASPLAVRCCLSKSSSRRRGVVVFKLRFFIRNCYKVGAGQSGSVSGSVRVCPSSLPRPSRLRPRSWSCLLAGCWSGYAMRAVTVIQPAGDYGSGGGVSFPRYAGARANPSLC